MITRHLQAATPLIICGNMGLWKDYHIWLHNTYGDQGAHTEARQAEFFKQLKPAESVTYPDLEYAGTPARELIISTSPSIRLILDLQRRRLSLEDVHWRLFEELVAELLKNDGYTVTVTKKTRDGGVDILAERTVPKIGSILSVWQAKKLKAGNKVGLGVIRELADSRNEFKASKGVIVTSTFLSRDAIQRIQRDRYILEGYEKPKVMEWIRNYGWHDA